jgi:hypothetical protein
MVFIGAGALAIGMAIHKEALANHRAPQARESWVYHCTTGEEMPRYEPCRDRKDQRDIAGVNSLRLWPIRHRGVRPRRAVLFGDP